MPKATYDELKQRVVELEAALADTGRSDIPASATEDRRSQESDYFLKCLETVSRAMNSSPDVDHVVDDILEAVLAIFGCDRVWLFHPCDPETKTIRVLAEKYKEEYPGAFASGHELRIDDGEAETIRKAISSGSPATFCAGSENEIDDVSVQFSVQSQMMMAIHPKVGEPWMFGMHQCSFPRIWSQNEQLLFKEISFRVINGLNNIILLRDLQKSERKARESAERLGFLMASIREGIFVHEKGVVLDANEQAARIWGYEPPEFIGLDLFDHMPPQSREEIRKRAQEKNEVLFDVEITSKVGTPVFIETCGAEIEYGGKTARVAVMRDVTVRKKVETEKLKVKKLEATAILAGGIAHDFNNLLNVVTGFLELSLEDLGPGHVCADNLRRALEASQKATQVANKFVTFSAGRSPLKRKQSVKNLLNESMSTISSHEGYSVDLYLPEYLWFVNVDKGQMSQAIENLVINAMETMEEGGCVRISAENMASISSEELGCDVDEGKFVKIRISDQGKGIPAQIIDDIFDPYFSTKEMGAQKGMGLGLSVALSVVRQHGGHLRIDSKDGVGTTALVYLPAAI